ncbi:glycosyl transferase [Streptomyces sulfonofaciens]|uniref:Glycosyl transferase n=1 Tax=Streptomyces sulfonofaciens TaxID=68272 RepID=A0A919GA47_9ACTN|nr:glycosyltransferase [Streptomyces sulfonofaciens]GHH80644.1 glycosyl transferase [Streptomyces sulfonofaciens]
MKVLCTTLGSPSHGRAQLPTLRALKAAGHDILVATAPDLADVFEPDGFRVLDCLPTISGETTQAAFKETLTAAGLPTEHRPEQSGSAAGRPPQSKIEIMHQKIMQVMTLALSGPLALRLREATLPVVRDFGPDLILRDGLDMSTVLVSEETGILQVATPSGAGNVIDPALIHSNLNAVREKLGLPRKDDPLSIVPYGRIDYVPPAFSFARHLPASFSYRQTLQVDQHAVLPSWIADLPADRPLVLAALGTALPMRHAAANADNPSPMTLVPGSDPVQTLGAIIDGVSRLDDCNVIVATSGLPVDRPDLPGHVHLTNRVPQPLLLESVDVFVTHGGFNSIRESLRTATPMAVFPHFGDQIHNAKRVQELGLGREITDRTADGVAAACRAVLGDGAITATTRAARLRMLALPEVESVATDLENLVERGTLVGH